MEAKNADLSALRIDRSQQEPPSQFSWRKGLVWSVALAGLAFGFYSLRGTLFSETPEVHLATAALTSPSQSNAVLTASGYVVAQRKAAVASKGTGRLVFLGVVEGDRVVKEQVIARLEDNDIRAQLEQAKANLKLQQAELQDATRTLERSTSLFAKQLVSQAELDAARARYDRVLASIDVAVATVRASDVAMENMLIRAPFDGTVLTKNADVGEIVAPLAASASSRAAVVTIADMRSLQVEADVSESNIERIAIRQPAEITLDAYPEKRYRAYVDKIVPTADRAKATVLVKVAFVAYDDRVLPEMSAKVLFLTEASTSEDLEQKPLLTVPSTAVVMRNDRLVVYKVADGRTVEVAVQTGMTAGSYVEILAGLRPGDKVVAEPTNTISHDIAVTVK